MDLTSHNATRRQQIIGFVWDYTPSASNQDVIHSETDAVVLKAGGWGAARQLVIRSGLV